MVIIKIILYFSGVIQFVMIAIITGDMINSRQPSNTDWLDGLKKILSKYGQSPAQWEIYRGDQFQLEVNKPEEALHTAFLIKAYLKTRKLDARMSIGLGEKNYAADKISESNGSAFVRSGDLFETLKKQKLTLAIHTGNIAFDTELNLMLRLGLTFMNHWLAQPAEYVVAALENPKFSQEEIGQKLGISQAAVSRRRKRAEFDLLLELDLYYRNRLQNIVL